MSVYENFTKCLCLFIYEKKPVDQLISTVKYFTYLTFIYFTSKNNILRIIVVNSCLFWHQFINYYKKKKILNTRLDVHLTLIWISMYLRAILFNIIWSCQWDHHFTMINDTGNQITWSWVSFLWSHDLVECSKVRNGKF